MTFHKGSFQDRFIKLFGDQDRMEVDLTFIQKTLNIILPKDFKDITRFYDGNNGFYMDGMYCYDSKLTSDNIVNKTLFLRKKHLPKRFIVLGEPPESIVLMETTNNEKKGRVLWLSYADAYNLSEGKSLEDNPMIFYSFSEFFDYLLTEEEKMREEEK